MSAVEETDVLAILSDAVEAVEHVAGARLVLDDWAAFERSVLLMRAALDRGDLGEVVRQRGELDLLGEDMRQDAVAKLDRVDKADRVEQPQRVRSVSDRLSRQLADLIAARSAPDVGERRR